MQYLLPIIAFLLLFQKPGKSIGFKTNTGDSLVVRDGTIFLNKRALNEDAADVIYSSRYNRLIEQDGNILLFLEIDGRPGFNLIAAFNITKTKATKVADCVYNDKTQRGGPPPFTDMDHDGYLEFGGFDLNEAYTNKDSMYYIPSAFYEISHGRVFFDSALTRKMDIRENGIYIARPFDADGNCCIVIKKTLPPKL